LTLFVFIAQIEMVPPKYQREIGNGIPDFETQNPGLAGKSWSFDDKRRAWIVLNRF
jgi:hypothetical protein